MPFSLSSFSSRFISGCLFITLISLVVWTTLPSQKQTPLSHLALHAIFKNIDGITLNSTVTLAGINVGHVENITFTNKEKTAATLTLFLTHPHFTSQKLALPDDSSVRIVTPNLFSEKILLIEPGGSLDSLKNGDSFFFTQNALVLDDILQYVMLSKQKNNSSSP